LTQSLHEQTKIPGYHAITFGSLYVYHHERTFGFFSYTVACTSSFYDTYVGWKRPILIYLSENI